MNCADLVKEIGDCDFDMHKYDSNIPNGTELEKLCPVSCKYCSLSNYSKIIKKLHYSQIKYAFNTKTDIIYNMIVTL